MAITNLGDQTVHFATSTTAATWGLNRPVKQVRATNRSATAAEVITVTIDTSSSAAAQEGGIVTAVALADESFVLPAGASKVIFKSPRAAFVAGSVIAASGTPGVSLEGTPWYD